jgi:5,6-dimethylbenzimidazole synthase
LSGLHRTSPACRHPVGLSHAWRFFVIVQDAARRIDVVETDYKACNADALASYSG